MSPQVTEPVIEVGAQRPGFQVVIVVVIPIIPIVVIEIVTSGGTSCCSFG